MSGFDRGPLRSYEVTWMSGHVETIQAHQVSWPAAFSVFGGASDSPGFIRFHGEFDGRWVLVLQAREADIWTVRDVTSSEVPS